MGNPRNCFFVILQKKCILACAEKPLTVSSEKRNLVKRPVLNLLLANSKVI